MKRSAIALITLFISTAYSQELAPVFEDSIGKSSFIKITGMNGYSSNRFSNDLMDKFIFGGEITDEIKDRSSNRLKSLNTFGGEFENRIDSYSPEVNPFGKEKYGFVISFSDNHFASANLSKDLFNTTFYGNANYVGDTMDFSFSHLQYQHYQKIGFGFYDKNTMSSVKISYIAGLKTLNGRFADSWMLTRENVDTVQLALQGSGFTTENFYPYWAFQGSGFAIDLDYNFTFVNKNDQRQVINLKINNLGAIFWNKNSNLYSVDSVTTYTGFDIQDFLNQDSTTENTYNFEDTLGIEKSIGNHTDVLPMELVVQKLPDRNSEKKWQPVFGFKAVLTSDYFPYMYGGIYYQPGDNFSMSSRISYGGFGGLKWGLNFNYWIKDKVWISLGTFDMLGNVSSKIGFGRSLNFGAYFRI